MITYEQAVEDDVRDAALIFAEAFEGEPTLRMASGLEGEAAFVFRLKMAELVIRARIEAGALMPVARREGQVVGMALPSLPDEEYWGDREDRAWAELIEPLAPGASERFEAYGEMKKRNKPLEPHAYVVALAVAPSCHGQGIGKGLLHLMEDVARAKGLAVIALDTAWAHNVPIYEKCGYRVSAEDELNGVRFWFMRKG
jgi:GNAT superfamily N-acetyltransferase